MIGSEINAALAAAEAQAANAIGGNGNDTIYGNDANNSINGGLGGDTIYGSIGSDTLDGDGGDDVVIYSYDISAFLVTLVDSVTVTLQHIIDSWVDTITEIENFIFNSTEYTFDDIAALDASMGNILFKFGWSGGLDKVWSTESGTETYTAADMGINGQSGNVATITRATSSVTVDILNSVGLTELRISGSDGADDITVNGLNNGMGVVFFGNAGNDEVTLSSIDGDSALYGSDGDDVLTSGSGDDILRGDAGADARALVHGDGVGATTGLDRLRTRRSHGRRAHGDRGRQARACENE